MLLRRSICIAAALATSVACAPSVPAPEANAPTAVDTAVFDPTNSKIPLPNDLVFQAVDTLPDSAQKDLLEAFKVQGGFPNDQEVPVTIDFQRQVIDPATGSVTVAPTTIDPTKVVFCPAANCNIAVLEITSTGVHFATLAAPVAADYVVAAGADHGTLTLHNAAHSVGGVQSKRWNTGSRYIVAVRGGASGLQATTGAIAPSATFFLLTQDKDLTIPANQSLIAASVQKANPHATPADIAAAAAQLEQLRLGYQSAFHAVDGVFPHGELAVMTTFAIQGLAQVQIDAELGVVPLPSDFLLDSTGHVQLLPATFGLLAAGIHTLDGFSTTATILAQTSGPILTSSVNSNTVFLYKYVANASGTVTGIVRQLDVLEALLVAHDPSKAKYIGMPPPITQGATSVGFIALQPAEPVATTGVPTFAVPPLEENTEYAVIVTDGVQDSTATTAAGSAQSIGSATASKLAVSTHNLVDSSGNSLVTGLDSVTAVGLEKLRQALSPVLDQLAADKGITRAHVRTAYTFRTQTITGKNSIGSTTKDPGVIGLAAIPYKPSSVGLPATFFAPGATPPTQSTAAEAFGKYGIETGSVGGVTFPNSNIESVLEFTVPTFNLLSDTTGAFDPVHPHGQEQLSVLMAVPAAAAVTADCPAAYGQPTGTKCAPLAIFHHGLGGTRAAMLLLADTLAKAGIVTVAIDAPKHGDRAYCRPSKDADANFHECNTGSTCKPIAALASQGDGADSPGQCVDGAGKTTGLRYAPQACASAACLGAWAVGGAAHGQAFASSEYLVSANFFRARDTFRQDVLDHSALIISVSPPPAAVPPNSIQAALVAKRIFIDPTNIRWVGQSFGSILGTINTAANPRIKTAVLNVGGGTDVDIFATAGSTFNANLIVLLTGLGVNFDSSGNPKTPADAAKYLTFLNVAKWILDPGDPINFAGHITANTLPDLLNTVTPGAPQAVKAVLGQIAECDSTVPNPTNVNLYLGMGLGPLFDGVAAHATASGSTLTVFIDAAKAGGSCVGFSSSALSGGTVPHGFLLSWGVTVPPPPAPPVVSQDVNELTGVAQAQAAAFLLNPASKPGNVVIAPLP